MTSSKPIVKKTVKQGIDLRRAAEPASVAPARRTGDKSQLEVTPERIRVRAYEIYQARNGAPGDADSDWCQAERELSGQGDAEPAHGGTVADPARLEVKPPSKARRRSLTAVRGGL